ncbi:thioredoxin, putative [Trypanosoma equiperdum]|uniref:Thioredoxin domain-containing protein n=4 Tax=Trypanozoon TaxID=39700 RepID=Q389F2_TRYB2|nr:hypothetical protein, conserved [Trypanosoma brucei gambiense DAL972]XP_823396.1 hypothetical protein, conserved [Trypanosoma brucei brucei TREU927]RHW68683.1 thioredoxin [Trypanosoma brucei equiperdum]SCU69824.1 thioredoxin, putative [Trypanosoma equiperdum]EAN78568.1 hypothetical protein, conserved [Trypanosoma brucei brucei TREU927]CBH16336.1 hypothetical protein, conserved [Trypanosoma brucei gambiense DAL972]|eukprot:XP_011778600.1 hypothetical protein, conserved [Trypanosoma brucei gambiense DAL972]
MTQNIIRRIFGNRELPENLSGSEYERYMQENFPKWIDEFEKGGFLEATKLPAIKSERDFLSKLIEHKDEIMVVKYWKHGCIPCLSLAEMYKQVSEQCKKENRRIAWYSVNTKDVSARSLVDYQLVNGTPTVQTFSRMKQVGKEIRAISAEELMRELSLREAALNTES